MFMKDKKNLLIIMLLIVVVVLSYGIISYSYTGANVSKSSEDKRWDVAITNVEIKTTGEAEEGDTKYSEGTLVVNPILNDVNDKITYKVTIENKGNIDAVLRRAVYKKENEKSLIKYDVDKDIKEIKSGKSVTVTIVASIDSKKYDGEKRVTNRLTALYEYIQK